MGGGIVASQDGLHPCLVETFRSKEGHLEDSDGTTVSQWHRRRRDAFLSWCVVTWPQDLPIAIWKNWICQCKRPLNAIEQAILQAPAIPLVMLRRQLAALQMALKNKNPPPPRRTTSPSSSPHHRLPTSSNTSNLSVEDVHSSDPDRASLNMMSALSHVNSSSAVLAAKAFAIATGIRVPWVIHEQFLTLLITFSLLDPFLTRVNNVYKQIC